MRFSWAAVRERKLVQWSLAYLAGAWLALQVVALLSSSYGWPPLVMRLAPIVLATGLLAVLVLAWYHGERGVQRVTGMELLILGALLVFGGGVIALVAPPGEAPAKSGLTRETRGPSEELGRSVAVLPFENLSSDPENAFFTDGMTEEITHALTKVPELRVVSRTSARQYAGSDKPVGEIGRELGVATVLEGSVRRAGSRVRITAQLIEAATDEPLWAETYDRDVSDVFEIQSEIAQRIAEELQASFTELDRQRILAGSTDDLVAYDLYLQATALMTRSGAWQGEVDASIELLRQAVRRDPRFARGWEFLAGLHQWSSAWRGPSATDSSSAALKRAMDIESDSPRARHIESIHAWYHEKDAQRAISLARQAAEMAPSDSEVVASLTQYYGWSGDLVEAARWGERLVALDPRTPESYTLLIRIYLTLELDDRAENLLARLIRLAPSSPSGWGELSMLRRLQGRNAEALAAADSAVRRNSSARFTRGLALLWAGDGRAAAAELEAYVRSAPPDLALLARPDLARAYRLTGQDRRAEAILAGTPERLAFLRTLGWNPPILQYVLVEATAGLNDREGAVQRLAEYVEIGGRDARLVAKDPDLEPIRGHPRYREVLEGLREDVAAMRATLEGEGR